jgi:hypothetical protein
MPIRDSESANAVNHEGSDYASVAGGPLAGRSRPVDNIRW